MRSMGGRRAQRLGVGKISKVGAGEGETIRACVLPETERLRVCVCMCVCYQKRKD